jgi:hypothetical protein
MRNQQMRKTQLPFLALCAVLLGGPVASEVKIFGNAVALAKVPGIELSRKQQRHFNEFKAKKSYFGAFYAAPGTDYSFWTRNFHSLNSAKMGAKKGCELGAKVAKCSLVAVLFPKGMDPNGNGLAGLGQRAGKEFASTYVKKQKKGKFGAFAINGASDHGFSYGWVSAAEANAAAIEFCNVGSAQALARLGIEGRKWARSNGLDKCRVIDTHSPD